MGSETIHVLASIISVFASGLVGAVIYYINTKIYSSVSQMETRVMGGLTDIRLEQTKVAAALSKHESNDDIKHDDITRRLENLEDRR